MSEDIIKIEIDKDSVVELADFIESELKPPSRARWILFYFVVGLFGGIGLGIFIQWVRWMKERESEDIGLRLLKLLLYRLYTMSYVIPLKWYEILIATVMGALLGLGIGSLIGSHLKMVR
jgi:hypothetical protein